MHLSQPRRESHLKIAWPMIEYDMLSFKICFVKLVNNGHPPLFISES